MARQAEAERERRAKVIAAQGELQASAALAEAARPCGRTGRNPAPLPPDAPTEIAAESNSAPPSSRFQIHLSGRLLQRPHPPPIPRLARSEAPPSALPSGDLSDIMSKLRLAAAEGEPRGVGWPKSRPPGSTVPHWRESCSARPSSRPRFAGVTFGGDAPTRSSPPASSSLAWAQASQVSRSGFWVSPDSFFTRVRTRNHRQRVT